MGPERKSRLISDEEKRIIAYHEAGHAVVVTAIPEADPVQKITIVGRGQAGGVTWFRPEDDRVLTSRKKMIAQLAGALGGRVAEQLVFDDITSGASNDLEQVTHMAVHGHPPGDEPGNGFDGVWPERGAYLPGP